MKTLFETIFKGAAFLHGHPQRHTLLSAFEYSLARACADGLPRPAERAAAVVISTWKLAEETGLDYAQAAAEFSLAIEARDWALEMVLTEASAAALDALRADIGFAGAPGFRPSPSLLLERVLCDYQEARGLSPQPAGGSAQDPQAPVENGTGAAASQAFSSP